MPGLSGLVRPGQGRTFVPHYFEQSVVVSADGSVCTRRCRLGALTHPLCLSWKSKQVQHQSGQASHGCSRLDESSTVLCSGAAGRVMLGHPG